MTLFPGREEFRYEVFEENYKGNFRIRALAQGIEPGKMRRLTMHFVLRNVARDCAQ
jgi:hypothetical protein